MLKENNKVLKCSNASPDWRGYVDFVNNVVVDGLSRVICASLEHLLDQVHEKIHPAAALTHHAIVNCNACDNSLVGVGVRGGGHKGEPP